MYGYTSMPVGTAWWHWLTAYSFAQLGDYCPVDRMVRVRSVTNKERNLFAFPSSVLHSHTKPCPTLVQPRLTKSALALAASIARDLEETGAERSHQGHGSSDCRTVGCKCLQFKVTTLHWLGKKGNTGRGLPYLRCPMGVSNSFPVCRKLSVAIGEGWSTVAELPGDMGAPVNRGDNWVCQKEWQEPGSHGTVKSPKSNMMSQKT